MVGPGYDPYVAIAATLGLVIAVAGIILILAHTIGPRRHGPVKDSAYESGMPILADTHRRFNVRFYIVAMLFLLFDVEVVFLWPWALVFHDSAVAGTTIPMEGGLLAGKEFVLGGMAFFLALLVFGLIYEWKKGAFEWT